MKNIIVAQHFEPYWENALKDNGTSFNEELEKFINFIGKNYKNIDEIIITKFEGYDFDIEHNELISFCEEKNITIKCIEYGYGWQREDDEDEYEEPNYPISALNIDWCYGQREYHDEYDILLIQDWQRDLIGNNIYLIGAFEGECICDIETVFNTIGLKFNRIDELIVGSGKNFDFYNIPKL